jgi:type IV pilus secretin PilQ/predicted competence protein
VNSWARWLCSGRSLVISSALAALAVVPVVAASDARVLVRGIDTRSLAGGLEVKIRTTGKPSYTTYLLESPARLAVDFDPASLEDVKNWTDLKFDNPYFEKATATPFSTRTGASVRVEFFLRGETTRQFEASADGLVITFYGQVQAPSVAAASAPGAAPPDDSSGLSLEVLSQEPPAESAQDVALADQSGGGSAAPDSYWLDAELIPGGDILKTLDGLAILAQLPSASGAVAPAASSSEMFVAWETTPSETAPPAVSSERNADQQTASQSAAAEDLVARPILDESAPAVRTAIDFRELEEAASLDSELRLGESRLLNPVDLAQTQSTNIGADQIQFQKQLGTEFTGAPISLDLKNIDVVELLRIFADLSNMNIILDPGIRGRVTVKMRDVPWDQAFITILRNQGLGFTVEGNIIRVATLRKLDAELRAQRQLREAQLVAEPLNTEIIYLNYAAPTQIRRLLTPQLSRRGQILTDARTNSLIVKDVQDNINRVKRLVEILDVRTRQVSVGAQIVTTSKNFTRDLGIAWNGSLIADPQHGNDTGLPFPNDVSTNFGVNLPASSGAGTISFALGNVLDTVKLNATLAAAEAEGLSKTISNPRVTTSDNVTASVRAGAIIPFQSTSISGNTIVGTVLFREAAISLAVTPHVTSDNFIRMRVTISADAPDFSAATAAGPQIQTKSLSTTVLVKDGDTFVVGGLNTSTEGYNENRVPFLHRLPVVGKLLFRNHRTSNTYADLLMFVTPNIVMDEAVKQKSLVFESYDVKDKGKTEQTTPSPNNP